MENLKEFQNQINALLSSFKEEISILRTNRPSPRIVENIYVNYMEQNMQIKQLGSITIEMPRDIIVTLWDKSLIPLVAKAIETANLGLSVSALENMVRAKLPELTTESLVPKSLAAIGVSFSEFLSHIIGLALGKHGAAT